MPIMNTNGLIRVLGPAAGSQDRRSVDEGPACLVAGYVQATVPITAGSRDVVSGPLGKALAGETFLIRVMGAK